MKAYLQLTKAQLLLFARNRNVVIWSLFLPLFMMVALGMLVGDGMRFQVSVSVVDEDGSPAARQFIGELEKKRGARPGPAAVRRRGGSGSGRGSGHAPGGEKGIW